MDERYKLERDLAHYRTLRALTTDEQAIEAIDETIRGIENRLAEIDEGSELGDRISAPASCHRSALP